MADPAKLKVGSTEFATIQADAATFATAIDGSEGELVKQARVLGDAIKASVAEWARKEQALLTEIDSDVMGWTAPAAAQLCDDVVVEPRLGVDPCSRMS